jgi:hypothetical protein
MLTSKTKNANMVGNCSMNKPEQSAKPLQKLQVSIFTFLEHGLETPHSLPPLMICSVDLKPFDELKLNMIVAHARPSEIRPLLCEEIEVTDPEQCEEPWVSVIERAWGFGVMMPVRSLQREGKLHELTVPKKLQEEGTKRVAYAVLLKQDVYSRIRFRVGTECAIFVPESRLISGVTSVLLTEMGPEAYKVITAQIAKEKRKVGRKKPQSD